MRIISNRHADDGMTLPEVMTAAAILLVCLTALATLLAGAINSSQTAKFRDQAANLANARIEAARALPYDSLGVRYANGLSGDPAGVLLTPETVGGFTVDTICTWVRTADGRAAYKKLTVRVSWQAPTQGHVDVTTMVYGKSGVVHSGDLLVRLRYREDGSPVNNASVAVTAADGSQRGVMSDVNGEAFFGQLSTGPVALAVTPPAGYIVDTSSITSASVSADSLTTMIVYVQKPGTTTIKVRSASFDGIPGATVILRRADGYVLPAVTTDSSGNAYFTDLLYSDYSATVSKDGYTSATLPFTVSPTVPGPSVRFTINQVTYADLLVRVRDSNGTPLAGASVWINCGANNVRYGTTNTAGEMPVSSIEATTYSVTAAKTNFINQIQTVVVGTTAVTLDMTLAAVSNGAMQITTLDKNGHAASIQVIVAGNGYYRNNLWSDSSGSLLLTGLVPGSYQVQCYTSPASVATVIINSGQTADVTVSQTKK